MTEDHTTYEDHKLKGGIFAVVDSWGKFLDGQLVGNTWASGLLDECIAIHVDQELPQAHFKGQYCAMSYK